MTYTQRRTMHKRVANKQVKAKNEGEKNFEEVPCFVMSLKERDKSKFPTEEEARQMCIYTSDLPTFHKSSSRLLASHS